MSLRHAIIVSTALLGLAAPAAASDYFIYATLDTGVTGSYGVDGYVGKDGVDRIVFYSGDTAYIYTVTLPPGAEPNMHPDNPEAPGPIAPRTFTLERTFDLGLFCGHQCEFYVAGEGETIYLGAAVGIHRYDYDPVSDTYLHTGQIAPAAPTDEGYGSQTLAYDPENDTWYAGAIAWNNDPGVTQRKMWSYAGSQGPAGTWALAFTYTTPEGLDPMTHHDGMEMVGSALFLADYVGDYIQQYTPAGVRQDIFWHPGLGHEVEGMGFGALTHFWAGSHGSTITEFGGGPLQQAIKRTVALDIKPTSCPNPFNPTSQGVLPVAILGSDDFDVTTIDPATILLAGVPPLRHNVEDVTAPLAGPAEPCACTDAGPDGHPDLTLKFDRQAITAALGPVADGDWLTLTVEGELFDGTMIEGKDCVVIRAGKAKKK